MMTAAQTLTVRGIERIAAVLPFADMIGEQARRCRYGAASAIVDSFASITGTTQDSSPPARCSGVRSSASAFVSGGLAVRVSSVRSAGFSILTIAMPHSLDLCASSTTKTE
jgi:hypothetical protein